MYIIILISQRIIFRIGRIHRCETYVGAAMNYGAAVGARILT